MSSIRLENVGKQFENGHVAVRDANLEIADGEFLVLVGPSGCGKSTTLRMVAGLEEVTDGKIFIGDRCVNDVEPGKRDIAMVFQNYALYPHMTVRENMSFGLKMRRAGKTVIHQRVTDAAEALSIESLLDRRPRELSGGQRQRVAVGRAVVRDPAAFLLDEPLSNLDARLRIQMRKELAQLHHRLKTTTLYVTHDQVEAMTLGQRIVVMNEGEIQQVATPMELYDHPANRFVAGFIGSPAMNLVDGEIETRDGHAAFCNPSMNYPVTNPESGQEPGPVCFGFRPEHVTLNPEDPKLAEVTIDVVERLGSETIVYCEIAGHPCIATMDGRSAVKRGDRLTLRLPASRSYLFSGDSAGRALTVGRQSVP